MNFDKSILIVGVGGLGVPAALAIARDKSVRHLGLMDPDPVELSNLHRQVIYTTADIEKPKVEAAAIQLRKINPALKIEPLQLALNTNNAREIIARYDFIVDGTDSPAAKFLINDIGVATATPFVYGGVLGMNGQAMTVIPRRTACIRCLFEGVSDTAEVASCREAGILGPIAGALGILQAHEAIAFAQGRMPKLAGGILTYDASATSRARFARVSPRPECICGANDRLAREPGQTQALARH
ncbi:MAG TPA: HesA/MoeB/ThiF family protein [Candidatus Binataceae bacterium]|nr:HesA/MoeB/ThiF family protein [Candidatus Binataceae bacterium]